MYMVREMISGHRREHDLDDQTIQRRPPRCRVRDHSPGAADIAAHKGVHDREAGRIRAAGSRCCDWETSDGSSFLMVWIGWSQGVALGRLDHPLNGDDPTVQEQREGVMARTACRKDSGVPPGLLTQKRRRGGGDRQPSAIVRIPKRICRSRLDFASARSSRWRSRHSNSRRLRTTAERCSNSEANKFEAASDNAFICFHLSFESRPFALGNRLPLADREPIAAWLMDQQYRGVHPFTGAAPGGWAWTDLPGGMPDADDTAGALVALHTLLACAIPRSLQPPPRACAGCLTCRIGMAEFPHFAAAGGSCPSTAVQPILRLMPCMPGRRGGCGFGSRGATSDCRSLRERDEGFNHRISLPDAGDGRSRPPVSKRDVRPIVRIARARRPPSPDWE